MPTKDREEIVVRLPTWHEDDLRLLCGIANAGGGRLVITLPGRDHSRKMRRYRKTFELIPRLAQESLGLDCTTEPIMDGAQLCLEISIPASAHPLKYLGKYYLYTNGKNTVIAEKLLERLFSDEASSWETRIQPFARREDLDTYTLERMVAILNDPASSANTDGVARERTTEEVLEIYGIKDRYAEALTNIGLLLLHRTPHIYLPGAFIKIGSFDETGKEIDPAKSITGPLTMQFRNALEALYGHYLPQALIAQNNATSSATLKLPPKEAVAEALLNALLHKDYESALPVRISVHPYQLHISNVGRPPCAWTEEDLHGRHSSRPNNPALADALNLKGLFNGWGNGINAMIRACQRAGVPQPKITLRPDETEVTFAIGIDADASAGQARPRPTNQRSERANPNTATHRSLRSAAHQSEQAAPRKKTFKDHSIAAARRLDMTSTDEYILKVIETNGRVTALRIAEVLGVSESTVRRSFRRLRELGFIERIGSNKAGYWCVVDKKLD